MTEFLQSKYNSSLLILRGYKNRNIPVSWEEQKALQSPLVNINRKNFIFIVIYKPIEKVFGFLGLLLKEVANFIQGTYWLPLFKYVT